MGLDQSSICPILQDATHALVGEKDFNKDRESTLANRILTRTYIRNRENNGFEEGVNFRESKKRLLEGEEGDDGKEQKRQKMEGEDVEDMTIFAD